MSLKPIKTLFLVAALYDIVLGIGFCLLFRPIYEALHYPMPEHPGYLQLAALYVTIFGIGFWLVYKDPLQNRAIALLGILMKGAFIVVAFGHLIADTVPGLYIVFASLDVVFLLLFVPAFAALNRMSGQPVG